MSSVLNSSLFKIVHTILENIGSYVFPLAMIYVRKSYNFLLKKNIVVNFLIHL